MLTCLKSLKLLNSFRVNDNGVNSEKWTMNENKKIQMMDKSWEVGKVIGFDFLQLVQFHSLFNFLPIRHPLYQLFWLIHCFNSPNSLSVPFHMVLPLIDFPKGIDRMEIFHQFILNQ